jgi:hemerythrin superfamily protein
MNALTLLEEQHAEVDDLFAKLEKAKDGSTRERLFVELADKIAAHATMEERIFYPAVKAQETEDMLLESVEEHLSVKRVLADLLTLDPDDEHFDAKIKVMKDQIEHHAHEEEEGKLFPKVRKLFSADELDALGGEMIALFESLLEESPRANVPSETEAAAPI